MVVFKFYNLYIFIILYKIINLLNKETFIIFTLGGLLILIAIII